MNRDCKTIAEIYPGNIFFYCSTAVVFNEYLAGRFVLINVSVCGDFNGHVPLLSAQSIINRRRHATDITHESSW